VWEQEEKGSSTDSLWWAQEGGEEINGEAFSETPQLVAKRRHCARQGFFSLSLFLCSFNWFGTRINLIFMMDYKLFA
jgi:hypothetical protein